MPAMLLARRPDVAAAEQLVVAANAQIGVAMAAFYPQFSLSSFVGFESANLRNLYLLDRSGRLLRTLMRGLEFASQAAWSPDGRTLAISLQPRGEPAGIWLVDPVSGRHRLLLRGTDFGAPIWLPDGHTLVPPVGSLPAPGLGSGPSAKARIGLYEISVPR